ncbi:MAG: hypothetical protein IT382_02635 [Deltaproteobacteria bacterium]|nr:hypothetical protein [Deltaproteobacteria bacterium]
MMRRRRALRGFCLALLAGLSCATPGANDPHAATREALSSFSAALAHAGMSVPLPPRICEEPSGPPRWDDEVGCVDGEGLDARAALEVYGAALVDARLPRAPAERSRALVQAWLGNDARFAELALAVERDFDARRAAKAPASALARAERGRAGEGGKKADKGAGPEGAGPSPKPAEALADAGPDAGSASGSAAEPAPAAREGAPAGDAGVVLSVRERLVGVWAVVMEGPIKNVYALCADGRATMHPETSDSALAELLDDMPEAKGSWEVVSEGPPPRVAFTWADERYEGEITELTAERVTIDYGDETVTAERRSSTASCD